MLLTLSLSKCALFYSSNWETYGTICEEHQDRKEYVIASACDIVQTHNVATCLQHSLHLHSSLQTVVQLGTLHPAVLGHRECGRLDQRDVTCTQKKISSEGHSPFIPWAQIKSQGFYASLQPLQWKSQTSSHMLCAAYKLLLWSLEPFLSLSCHLWMTPASLLMSSWTPQRCW